MGELVQKNDHSLFDWRKIIKQASVCFENTQTQYCLPYHKSDLFYRSADVIFTMQDVANPVALLKRYVSWHDRIHGTKMALFLWKNGSHPSRSWFELKLFAILDRRYGGHSLWTGYATFLASLGVPESIIQAVSRWSSEAWKIYIRKNPAIRVEQQLAVI